MTDAVALTEVFEVEGRDVRWGTVGSGPAVVLCHGTPWSSYLWRSLARELAATHQVYVWDMLGYGLSDMSAGDVSLRKQGQVLAALISHWQLDRPHVIAHDFGGAVSLRAHLLHGAAYSSLALVDVVALRPWGSPFFKLVQEHWSVFESLPSNLHEALVREYIGGASFRGLHPAVHTALTSPWLTPEGQAGFYRQIAQADEAFTDEIEERYSTITIPTLIVWGTDDTWIPPDRADRLEAMIPGSRKKLMQSAGHLIQEDAPGPLNSALVDWLHQQDPSLN